MTTAKLKVQDGLLFDQLRAGFKFVAENASHVSIREDRLESYARDLKPLPRDHVFDAQNHYSGDDESTASYVLALDAINFGSGYKPHLKEEGWELVAGSIYFTVARNLKNFYEQKGPATAGTMARMTPQDVAKILKLDLEMKYSADFSSLCALNLRELGGYVRDVHAGSFMNLVNAANGSAGNMVRELVGLSQFNDTHPYKGCSVAFYKRAQIAAADMYLAFRHKGRELFNDTANFTIFADNALPHILRMDGILEYSEALSTRINNRKHILSGSEEEIELRACAAHAVEQIAKFRKMSVMDVDHILWHASTESPHYRLKPTHRTFTRFY